MFFGSFSRPQSCFPYPAMRESDVIEQRKQKQPHQYFNSRLLIRHDNFTFLQLNPTRQTKSSWQSASPPGPTPIHLRADVADLKQKLLHHRSRSSRSHRSQGAERRGSKGDRVRQGQRPRRAVGVQRGDGHVREPQDQPASVRDGILVLSLPLLLLLGVCVAQPSFVLPPALCPPLWPP